jgi:hypothetical protein
MLSMRSRERVNLESCKMKKRIKIVPYTVGAQFAPLIANADSSGLDNDEVHAFAGFDQDARDAAPRNYTLSHYDIDTNSHDEFARCVVTGMRGACYQVNAVYFKY